MSDTPSLISGSPDTPGSVDIPIGSSNNSLTSRWLVISVVEKSLSLMVILSQRPSQKILRNNKMLLDTHGRVLLNSLVNSIGMNSCEILQKTP
ncbi:hypothetical protein P3S67_012605 [Capsicum chacoense]